MLTSLLSAAVLQALLHVPTLPNVTHDCAALFLKAEIGWAGDCIL